MKKSRIGWVWIGIIVVIGAMVLLGLQYKQNLNKKQKQAGIDIQRQVTPPAENLDITIKQNQNGQQELLDIKKFVRDFLMLTEQFDYLTYSQIEMGYDYMTPSLAEDIRKKITNLDQTYQYAVQNKQQLSIKNLVFTDVKKESEDQTDQYNYLVKTKATMELRQDGKIVNTYTTAYDLVLVMGESNWKVYKIQTRTIGEQKGDAKK